MWPLSFAPESGDVCCCFAEGSYLLLRDERRDVHEAIAQQGSEIRGWVVARGRTRGSGSRGHCGLKGCFARDCT